MCFVCDSVNKQRLFFDEALIWLVFVMEAELVLFAVGAQFVCIVET